MTRLVDDISKSKYAAALYPSTSMLTLLLGQTAQFDTDRSVVVIESRGDEIYFEFRDSAMRSNNWKRVVDHGEAYAVLIKLIQSKKWLVDYDKRNA